MKKTVVTIVALLLAVAMAVSAFAAQPPKGEVLYSAEGPKVDTSWWYDAWLDSTQKRELSAVLANATHLVLAVEGEFNPYVDSNGYKAGFQDNVNWNQGWEFALWTSFSGEGQLGAEDYYETVDGITYIYMPMSTAREWFAANGNGFDMTEGTGYNFIIGVAPGYPTVGLYAVNSPEVNAPAEEPAPEEAPSEPEEPTEDEPAETGLALSLIPAAIALAVVVLKRR